MKFLLIPLAARLLGAEELGIFYYCYSLLTAIFILTNLGINDLLTREFNNANKQQLIGTMLGIKLSAWGVACIASIVIFYFIQDPIIRSLFFIFLLRKISDEFRLYIGNILNVRLDSQYPSWGRIIESIVTTASACYILLTHPNLLYFSVAYLAGSILSTLFLIIFSLDAISFIRFFSFSEAKRLTIMGLPFIGTAIIGILLITTDTLMIKWLKGAEAVGYYQASYRVIDIGIIISLLIIEPIYPLLSKFQDHVDKIKILIKKSFSILLLLAFPILLGGEVIGKDLILMFFGSSFSPSIIVFKIMLVTLFISFPLNLFNRLALILHLEKTNMIISGTSALANIVLNLIFIPLWGIVGAAVATLISKLADLMVTTFYCHNKIGLTELRTTPILKYLFSSLIMSGVLILIPNSHPIFKIVVGATLYIVILLILKESYTTEFIAYMKSKYLGSQKPKNNDSSWHNS